MSEEKTFTKAVVACLIANAPDDLEQHRTALTALVTRVLDEVPEEQEDQTDRLLPQPSREQIEQYLTDIRGTLSAANDRVALIAGGATKIKGYVFEAPKLPEIRGASALLDWVNEVGLNDLWYDRFESKDADRTRPHPYIIYASGGGFLAFAPADLGAEMAAAVERCYTEHTLTANSVAVSHTFSLLELRYGHNPLAYWVEEFLRDWRRSKAYRKVLAQYYYCATDQVPDSLDDQRILLERFTENTFNEDPLRRRDQAHVLLITSFLNRKTFGELVTLLATMTNRRRDERATHGDTRSVPLYELIPWSERCDSSGVRPAIMHTTVGDEISPREMSEASARKRYVGQLVKVRREERDRATAWFIEHFGDAWANQVKDLDERAWEQRWQDFLNHEGKQTPYAEAIAALPATVGKQPAVRPAQDVGEIGQASSPGRYIGVIYADGNNVGRLIATLKTPSQYAETSEILRDAAKDAVFKALAEHVAPALVRTDKGERRWVHPFEILAIGGDDLFLIVPGDCAFDVALAIGYNFEVEIAKKLHPPKGALSSAAAQGRYGAGTRFITDGYTPSIGLSAGVIIAQENAPIFFLRGLVEELLKIAKDRAKVNAKKSFFSGAVDFMVMKSITMVTDNIKAFRTAALGDADDANKQGPIRRLTARPYTWHEFAGLLATVRALKQANAPRSQLYRLRRALDAEPGTGVVASVMEYLYTRSRLRGAAPGALMEYIEHNWCYAPLSSGGRGGLPPWLPLGDQRDRWETFWPDLLEAYEMVPKQGER